MPTIFQKSKSKEGKNKRWLKRAGIVAFLFFLIKGLIWIGVAVAAWISLRNS